MKKIRLPLTIKAQYNKVLTSPTLQQKGVKPKQFINKLITVFLQKTEVQN